MLSNSIHIGRRGGVRLTGGGSGGIDPDAVALIALMDVAPDGTRQGHINTLVTSLKTAGVWTLLDELWIMAAHDAQAARLGWKRYKNLTAVNSPTFTTDQGYAGNGTTSYLDTGFVPSTDGVQYTLNDASAGVYSRTNSVTNGADMGADSNTANALDIRARYLVNLGGPRVNSNADFAVTSTDSRGLFVGRRSANNAMQWYRNGVSIGSSTTASTNRPIYAVYIGALNRVGSPAIYTTRQYAAAFVGAAMSEAQQLSLYNAIQTYMTAVGAQV